MDPWSGRIPHAEGQLSQCSPTTIAHTSVARAPRQEKSPQREAHVPQRRPPTRWRRLPHSTEAPAQPKRNLKEHQKQPRVHLGSQRKVTTFCCCSCLVAQSCPNLCNPLDCVPPGSSIRGIFQARILEWVAIPFSRGEGIEPTQGLNLGLLHCRKILCGLIHQGSQFSTNEI